MSEQNFASLLPGDADQSGFLDGVTATIVSARATTFDYNGKLAEPVPAIAVTFLPANGKESVQHYTVGKPADRAPSDDGARFKVFGSKKALPKDSNGLAFIISLINAGFPQDKVGDDLTVFDNTVVLLKSQAVPKTEGQEKDRTIVLAEKIVTLPWENKAPKAAATTKAAGKTAAAPAAAATATSPMADEAAKDAASNAVVAILADTKNQAGVKKAQVGSLAFRTLSQDPNRNNAVKLLSQLASEFLPTIVGTPVIAGDEMVGTVAFDGEKVYLEKAA